MNITIEKTGINFGNHYEITYDEIRKCIGSSENDIIYLGGSIIEGVLFPISQGMGNHKSDIDVFIIRKHANFVNTQAVYSDAVRKTFFCNIAEFGIDIEVYDEDFVFKLIDTLNTVALKANERIYNVFLGHLPQCCSFETINSFLCRLNNSVCINGMEQYDNIKKQINFQNFLEMMISNTVIYTDNILEDVQGNLDASQLNVALFCMRQVALNVMSIILMNEGFFVDRAKWIQLKFDNLCKIRIDYFKIKMSFDQLFRGNLLQDEICYQVIQDSLNKSKQTIENILLGELQIC